MISEPPAGWTIRAPTLDDVADILAVVHASDIAAVGEPDFSTEEVIETLTAPGFDRDRDSWVAIDPTGLIQGWAYLEHAPLSVQSAESALEHLEVYIEPEAGVPAQRPLFDRALARIRERGAELGHPEVRVRAGLIASETAYVAMLVDAGFAFVKRHARMVRPITGDETVPVPPAGVTVRPVRADDDAELRAFFAVTQEAFAELPDPVLGDYDDFRARLAASDSVPWDEWFVAEVDGVLAGVLRSSNQSVEHNEGWVRTLGVARPYRGRGLAQLLLRTAFAAYAAKGRTSAGLGVDLTNPTNAYRVYESVGLRPRYEVDIYERPLPTPHIPTSPS
jgi:mycothiol synthase